MAPSMSSTASMNDDLLIKSEPLSPPRETHTPTSLHLQLCPPINGHMGLAGSLSPNNLNHSNSTSPIASQLHGTSDFDGPLMKRPRLVDAWSAS